MKNLTQCAFRLLTAASIFMAVINVSAQAPAPVPTPAPNSAAQKNKASDKNKPTDKKFVEAFTNSRWAMVKQLVLRGADVNAVAPESRETALYDAAYDSNFEMVKFLLEKGASVNAADIYGITPLHRAIVPLTGKVNVEIVKLLLEKGADPNALTRYHGGSRPLAQAIAAGQNSLTLTEMLLEKGADPNLSVSENRNALDEAIYREKPEIAALLKPLVKDTVAERRKKLPGKFVQTAPNIDIYYEIYGQENPGVPLVVLHGGPGFDHQYFLANSAFTELAKNRPVIFYDQRGTGFSSAFTFNQSTTVANQLEDLTSLVNQLGYEKFDLMGHSWGGFLAMMYAAFFPDRLSHLIICDTMAPDFANFESYSTFEKDYPELNELSNQKKLEGSFNHDAKALRESLVAYMSMLFHSPQKRDAFIAASNNFTYNIKINTDLSAEADNLDLTPALPKINVPTLILHGQHDANIIPDVARDIQAKIPKSQLVIFEESGHLPFYEEPEKFISTVEKFLSQK